jgi:hypothetical protein
MALALALTIGVFGSSVPQYSPNAWSFNGTTSRIQTYSDLSGNGDHKQGIISFWYKNNGAGRNSIAVSANGSFVEVLNDAAGSWTIILLKVGGGDSVGSIASSTSRWNGDGQWHHFMASWDGSATCATHMYVDNVNVKGGVTTCADLAIDYTRPSHYVSGVDASQLWSGCLAEVYVNYSEFLDLSVVGNRRKFINVNRKPVYLGDDGSAPTGNQPLVYLKNTAASVTTNSGSGGNYTKAIDVTACSDNP